MHQEDGLTLVELAIASALSLLTLGVMLGVLYAAVRTTRAAQQESDSLETAQVAMTRIDRDIRGATTIVECIPEGYCLGLHAQLGDGSTERVRYRLDGTSLLRDRDCADGWATCAGATEELVGNVGNLTLATPEEAFDCVTGRRAEVRILLIVSPLQSIAGQGGGTVRLSTSAVARGTEVCA